MAGSTAGTVTTRRSRLRGDLSARWDLPSGVVSSFAVSALSANSATVTAADGSPVGSGRLDLLSDVLQEVLVSGAGSAELTGNGTLSSYANATTNLGVSGVWTNYDVDLSGFLTLDVSTSSLILNGTLLPAGRYKINTAASQLSGRGPTATPNFAGSVSVDATNADFDLGNAPGSATLGNSPLDVSQGFTLTGFRGSVQIATGTTSDAVSWTGTAEQGLVVGGIPALTTDQNMPVSFDMHLQTSLDDRYVLAAEAPIDWTVSISETGTVTLTPAPGLQAGDYVVRAFAGARPVNHNWSPMPRSWCMSLPLHWP